MVAHVTLGAQGWDACMSAVYRWRVREEETNYEKGYFFKLGSLQHQYHLLLRVLRKMLFFSGKGKLKKRD